MNYNATRIKNWRIVFAKQDRQLFWSRYVPNMHFNHCELVGRDDFGWLVVRPMNAAVQILMLGREVNELPEDWIPQSKDVKVLRAKHHKAKRPRVICFAPWTCVEVCKAHLNISCWWVGTPDQLYTYIKHNGKPPLWWSVKNIVLSSAMSIMMLISSSAIYAVRGVYEWFS